MTLYPSGLHAVGTLDSEGVSGALHNNDASPGLAAIPTDLMYHDVRFPWL